MCEIGQAIHRGPHEGLVKVEVKGEKKSKSSVFFTYRVSPHILPSMHHIIDQVVLCKEKYTMGHSVVEEVLESLIFITKLANESFTI